MRPQPIYASASLEPVIDFGFALEPFDVPNFGAGVVSLDLPVVFCDALRLEGNPRRFAHGRQYGRLTYRFPGRVRTSARPPVARTATRSHRRLYRAAVRTRSEFATASPIFRAKSFMASSEAEASALAPPGQGMLFAKPRVLARPLRVGRNAGSRIESTIKAPMVDVEAAELFLQTSHRGSRRGAGIGQRGRHLPRPLNRQRCGARPTELSRPW